MTGRGWLATDSRETRIRIGDRWQTVEPALCDVDALLADTDRAGISVRVISLPPFLLRHDLDPADGIVYSRAMNDGLRAVAASFRDRLRVLATVPLQAPAAAADELRRATLELGFVGAEIATNVAARMDLDALDLEPFWGAAESLGAIVLIHPHDVRGAERMHGYHLRNLIGNPLETAAAAACLVFGGVLARHPGLRIVLSHGGGAFPWLLGRLDRGFAVRPECRTVETPPSEWAKRFLYDSVVFDGRMLAALAAWVGADRVVVGTDFPFDMRDPDPVGVIQAAIPDRPAQEAILRGNASALLDGQGRAPNTASRDRDTAHHDARDGKRRESQ
ncbi:MAG: amidohydrolase family protein [Armatimonadota bacterium]|nr:amidohydrolase family protein [Armatimonadota bacterium]